MPLLIENAPEVIQCAQVILDFSILTQYVSYDEETLYYMEHALYRLKKTKIVFEQHWLIHSKLCRLTFNYLKFDVIRHFVQCIWNYSSMVNYNTAHSKTVHKYLLKALYNKTNKKKYKSHIWQHNVRHINIITIKDGIISEKVREKKLSEGPVDTTVPAEVA